MACAGACFPARRGLCCGVDLTPAQSWQRLLHICCASAVLDFAHPLLAPLPLLLTWRCSLPILFRLQMPGWTGLANARVTIFGEVYKLPSSLQDQAQEVRPQLRLRGGHLTARSCRRCCARRQLPRRRGAAATVAVTPLRPWLPRRACPCFRIAMHAWVARVHAAPPRAPAPACFQFSSPPTDFPRETHHAGQPKRAVRLGRVPESTSQACTLGQSTGCTAATLAPSLRRLPTAALLPVLSPIRKYLLILRFELLSKSPAQVRERQHALLPHEPHPGHLFRGWLWQSPGARHQLERVCCRFEGLTRCFPTQCLRVTLDQCIAKAS